jgi:hypothetical protein
MRPFRLRVVTALVLAVLMLGSLASVANAGEIFSSRFVLAPWNAQPVPTSFPEDPWPVQSVTPTSFPEDPWPAFTNAFPEDPWPNAN